MHVQAVFIPFIFVRMEEKGKILIIDDNKDVLFALNLLLEPYMQKVKVTTQPARIENFMRKLRYLKRQEGRNGEQRTERNTMY